MRNRNLLIMSAMDTPSLHSEKHDEHVHFCALGYSKFRTLFRISRLYWHAEQRPGQGQPYRKAFDDALSLVIYGTGLFVYASRLMLQSGLPENRSATRDRDLRREPAPADQKPSYGLQSTESAAETPRRAR